MTLCLFLAMIGTVVEFLTFICLIEYKDMRRAWDTYCIHLERHGISHLVSQKKLPSFGTSWHQTYFTDLDDSKSS